MLLNKERAYQTMAKHGLDALVLCQPKNVTYFSDFPRLHECTLGPQVYVIFPRDPSNQPCLIFRAQAIAVHTGSSTWVRDYRLYSLPMVTVTSDTDLSSLSEDEQRLLELSKRTDVTRDPVELLITTLREKGLASAAVGIDEAFSREAGFLERLREALPGAAITPASRIIRKIRLVKTPEELHLMEEAVRMNEAGLNSILKALRAGVSERELSAAFEAAVRAAGGFPHYCNVGAGARGALPTKLPGDYRVKAGDIVMIDLDVLNGFYFSDIGRTAVVGTPSEKVRRYWHAVSSALETAESTIRPGATAADVYAATLQTLRAEGIPHYNVPYMGHAIGMDCYEGMVVHGEDHTLLEPGMVINLEPSYYELGLGCIHLEDTVVVTSTGCRSLQHEPLGLRQA